MSIRIPFNKPFFTGAELSNIQDAVASGTISGNGPFTKKCQSFFEDRYGWGRSLMTSSCTDALEMCSILIDIKPGDEVIVPSFTFVSTANAFLLRGAVVRFVDSRPDHPGMDEEAVEELINERTKAIVAVHYAGVASDMHKLRSLCDKNNLYLIEDAAQAIESYYDGRPLGSYGDLATFSFHETKNVIAGEGGLLVVNNTKLEQRAEIIWEKGTNRSAFFRGEIDKYGWVDIGSSYLPSELVSAFLFAQLQNIEDIQARRLKIWNRYNDSFQSIRDKVQLPLVPKSATNNAHMYYMICKDGAERSALIKWLKDRGILAVFHYQSLEKSQYFLDKHDGRVLSNSNKYSDQLIRLPLYYGFDVYDQDEVINSVIEFYA